MSRSVCFVTLSRSDYSSLRPVIRAASKDSDIEVRVVAGGSHLLDRFGKSIDDIRSDNIAVSQVIDFLNEKDNSRVDIARSAARAFQAFVEYLAELNPDRVFILGDRWEMLAVAQAASLLGIPIIHHSGGDVTQGSADNQTRYAITVLSHIHLVALNQHRKRLLRMGEEDWRVIWVGEPALTDIPKTFDIDVRSMLGLPSTGDFVLATYHPTSFESLSFASQAKCFIEILDLIDSEIVLTAPNPDPGSESFLAALRDYSDSRDSLHLFENLGSGLFYAAMNEASYMIGNSSSGIWEAPSFALPVINIGCRQQDRLRGDNVIDVALDRSEAARAISNIGALVSERHLSQKQNPYVKADTLDLILDAIKMDVSKQRLLAKIFVDPLTRN